jgi:histidinol-phosphate/aromatic aminotransferase/cobyric acid decarboxylase-like protein
VARAELDKVALPYHLDAASRSPARLALQFQDDMDARVQQIVGERERVFAALAGMALDVVPAERTSSSSSRAASRVGRSGRSCSIAAS